MRREHNRRWLLGAVVLFGCAWAAFSQAPQPPQPPPPPGGDRRGDRPGGPGGPEFTPTTVVSTADDVVVLKGNVLLRYDGSDLRQTAKATLPEAAPAAGGDNNQGRRPPVFGSVAIHKRGIFVVYGQALYQYSSDLKLKAQGTLAADGQRDGFGPWFMPCNLLVTDTDLYTLRGNQLTAVDSALKVKARVNVPAEGMGGWGQQSGGEPLMMLGNTLCVSRGGIVCRYDKDKLKLLGGIVIPDPDAE